jgi:hypothetical protein
MIWDRDLFERQRLSRSAQIAVCMRVAKAVNEAVYLQNQLGDEVLKNLVHCQVDANRALHAARSTPVRMPRAHPRTAKQVTP